MKYTNNEIIPVKHSSDKYKSYLNNQRVNNSTQDESNLYTVAVVYIKQKKITAMNPTPLYVFYLYFHCS